MMKSSCFSVFLGCIGIKSNVKLALSDIFVLLSHRIKVLKCMKMNWYFLKED